MSNLPGWQITAIPLEALHDAQLHADMPKMLTIWMGLTGQS